MAVLNHTYPFYTTSKGHGKHLKLRMCKTKGVRTFGSTAAEIVCRGATLNTLSSFDFNCVYYALERVVQITETSADLTLASVVVISGSATNHHSAYGVHLRC